MESLTTALNLNTDTTEEEVNRLALAIMESEYAKKKESVLEIATALLNIGQYRISGNGFSDNVSDIIASWIEKYFKENEIYTDKLVDVIYELTSKKSDELPMKLMDKVKDENLKRCLLDAFCYKRT